MKKLLGQFVSRFNKRVASGALLGVAVLGVGVPSCAVVEPVRKGDFNTLNFRVSAYDQPQIGQSFAVVWPMDIEQLEFSVSYVMTIPPERLPEFFAASIPEKAKIYQQQPEYGPFDVDIKVDIYRATTGNNVADTIDVSQGFELVDSIAKRITIERTNRSARIPPFNAKFPFGKIVTLTPGSYFVSLSFDWPAPELYALWLNGRESGANTFLGPDQNGGVTSCRYTPAVDKFPTGRAYQGDPLTPWGGTSTKVEWGTRFRFTTSKVAVCANDPATLGSGGVWNQGDLGLNLIGKFHKP